VKVVGYRSGFHRFRVAVSLDRFTNIPCLNLIVNPFFEISLTELIPHLQMLPSSRLKSN
jgi:hypothetical protein